VRQAGRDAALMLAAGARVTPASAITTLAGYGEDEERVKIMRRYAGALRDAGRADDADAFAQAWAHASGTPLTDP
jgi:hypothetical protein